MRALLKMADLVDADAEKLGCLEAENVGKVLALSMSRRSRSSRTSSASSRAPLGSWRSLAAGEYKKGFTSILRREPIGVAGLIAPWNYPLYMSAIGSSVPRSRPGTPS